MGEFRQYLGIRWTPTARISDVENLDADRTVQISFRQWVLLLTLIRLGSEGSSEAKSAIDLASVLQGFSWAQLAQDGMSSLGQAEVGRKTQVETEHPSLAPNERKNEQKKSHCPGQSQPEFLGHQDRKTDKATVYPFTIGISLSPFQERITSGDSVAADPRNDATPDTSAKGVRDDA